MHSAPIRSPNTSHSKSDTDLLQKTISYIKKSQESYASNFDFTTDASLQRYISKVHPLKHAEYIPADLESVDRTHISTSIKNPKLRSPARIAFEQMAKDFYDTFDKKLILKSAYRSYESQKNLISQGCSLKQCAEAGTSEHQLGLAVDIHIQNSNGTKFQLNKSNNPYYEWLDQNAHLYGFHNTYKRGLHTDGEQKINEYRHRRYCSIPLATFLYENDLSL